MLGTQRPEGLQRGRRAHRFHPPAAVEGLSPPPPSAPAARSRPHARRARAAVPGTGAGALPLARPPCPPSPAPRAGPGSGQKRGPNRGLHIVRTQQPLLTMMPAPGPARNAASGLWLAEPGSGGHALAPRANQRPGTIPSRALGGTR